MASDNEDEHDAEAAFLASLTDKQKRKLLRYISQILDDVLCAQVLSSSLSLEREEKGIRERPVKDVEAYHSCCPNKSVSFVYIL